VKNKLILFDLDGTLIDTAPDFVSCLNNLLFEHKRDLVDYNTLSPLVSLGTNKILQTFFPEVAPDTDEFIKLRTQYLNYYAATAYSESIEFAGIDKLLDSIEQAGGTWGIVTNKPQRFALPICESFGYMQKSACLVCGDTLANAKPHPQPVQHAMALAGFTADNCVFIGDAANDIISGNMAGTKTIAVSYGYIPPEIDLNLWKADFVANTPDEILNWILQWNQ